MLGRISAQSFTFDQDFRPYYGEKFALVRLIYYFSNKYKISNIYLFQIGHCFDAILMSFCSVFSKTLKWFPVYQQRWTQGPQCLLVCHVPDKAFQH